jgi:hypothetical protein
MNDRGQYADRDRDGHRGSGWGGVAIAFMIMAGIYALSPGARHFYKHGRLPP